MRAFLVVASLGIAACDCGAGPGDITFVANPRYLRFPSNVLQSNRPIDALGNVPVASPGGALIPLAQLAEISLELRRSEFDASSLLFDLYNRGLVAVLEPGEETRPLDTVEAIQERLALAEERFRQKRYDLARKAYEEVLELDRLNQNAKKGLVAVAEARDRERTVGRIPLAKVPVVRMELAQLTKQNFDPQEGFVLSRVNGQWDVQSILKLCPMAEEDALMIFARLLERKVIELI